jgi:hypothetical protein
MLGVSRCRALAMMTQLADQFFQQQGHIGIRNCEARRIDRSGERPAFEPLLEPSPQSKLVEPHRRHERPEKPLALRCVKPRPALHNRLVRSTRRISRAYKRLTVSRTQTWCRSQFVVRASVS